MITHDEPRTSRQTAIGFIILAVGILIGAVGRPAIRQWTARTAGPEPNTPVERLAPEHAATGTAPAGDLPTLSLDLPPRSLAVLQAVRDRAVRRGMIVQERGDLVPARVRYGDADLDARVRIKGDFLDHVLGDRWSLRIELREGNILGMRRFSIQSPHTRQFLWEWLAMAAARRDGLLAPRSTFVEVAINGEPKGIYYLEEHPSKELLEAQGRREGPIVRFVEGTGKEAELQYNRHVDRSLVPPTVARATGISVAEISGYGEKRLEHSEDLARQLARAVDLMRGVQATVADDGSDPGTLLARLQARVEIAGRDIDRAIDVDDAARMHALVSLFRSNHALYWPNRRFYHNAITDRLEPILYDVDAGLTTGTRDPIEMASRSARAMLGSTRYYDRLFAHLGRMTEPEWMEGLRRDVGPDLARFGAALRAEGTGEPGADPAYVWNELRTQQVYLRDLVRPRDAVNFDARLLAENPTEAAPRGTLEVEAWATTAVPVVLRGFRFQNGRFVAAREALRFQQPGTPDAGDPGAVVLPHDGRRTRFGLPVDQRLEALGDIGQVKRAARDGGLPDRGVRLLVDAEWALVSDPAPRRERLAIRETGVPWRSEGARPEAPTVAAALAAHSFLRYVESDGRLEVLPGSWDVTGDLVVPDGHALAIGPGTTLRFDPAAALVATGELTFSGTREEPVVLGPRTVDGWQGVVVLDAPRTSRWEHVRVRSATAARRGGWIETGGVTFYRSPVEMLVCRIEDARGEDALNVFDARVSLREVSFDGAAHDGFDGDFVDGEIVASSFRNTGEDAIDLSGSRITLDGNVFAAVGDKAISAGERSRVRVHGGTVRSASIGIASKDDSRVIVDGLNIVRVENYGLTAFIKKPEYGPSEIEATDVRIGEAGRGPLLAQESCGIRFDGRRIASVRVDVDAMYRSGILGK